MKENQTSTYREHDCNECSIFHNQADSTYFTCMTCNRVTSFSYKSFWKRLKEIFN